MADSILSTTPAGRSFVGRRQTSSLVNDEPMAPEVDTDLLEAKDATPGVEAEGQQVSAPATAARRRTTSLNNDEPAAPVVSDSLLAASGHEDASTDDELSSPGTAADDLAKRIDAPAAPRDPVSGETLAPPEMRARILGGEAAAAPTDTANAKAAPDPDPDLSGAGVVEPSGKTVDTETAGAPSATPAASVPPLPTDEGLADTFQPPQPLDPVNELLVSALMLMRSRHREKVNADLESLSAQRHAAAASLAQFEAQEAQARHAALMAKANGIALSQQAKAAALAQGPGGGSPSLLGGLGAGVGAGIAAVGSGVGAIGSGVGALSGAVARTISGNTSRAARREVLSLDRQIRNLRFERKVTDQVTEKAILSANNMYQKHLLLRETVRHFNEVFEASPEGGKFLGDLQTVAQAKGITVKEVRQRIHDLADTDPEILPLRQQADALARDPKFDLPLGHMEMMSTNIRDDARSLHRYLKDADEKGVELTDLDDDFTDAIKAMDVDDCALAKPGGQKLDNLKERMKEMTESLVEAIRKFVSRVREALGFGTRSP